MNITAADVNELRKISGAGMMDCKKALQEANGDMDKAVEILRKSGQKVAAKRADNETSEGRIIIRNSADKKNAKLLALACETEPVSKVDDFNKLAEDIMDTAVKINAKDNEELMAATLADGRTVETALTELIGKIGEKIIVSTYLSIDGEDVESYLHSNNKAAAIVVFSNTGGANVEELGKDIGMQIVAMKPIGLDKDDVDPALIEKEIEIGKEQARQEGKPEELLEKIAMGKLGKFYKENTLLNQDYVKDPSETVAKHIDNTVKGIKIDAFYRVSIG